MAQQSTLTNTPAATGSTTYGNVSATVAYLLTRIVSGNVIYASDLDLIKQSYNAYLSHTHNVADLEYLAYGDVPAYSTTYTSGGTTSNAPVLSSISLTFSSGSNILGSARPTMATAVNNMRVHAHVVSDHTLP